MATAVVGVLLVVVAIVIVLSADRSMLVGTVLAALVVGLPGVDACIGAALDRPSLLQRLGPLP